MARNAHVPRRDRVAARSVDPVAEPCLDEQPRSHRGDPDPPEHRDAEAVLGPDGGGEQLARALEARRLVDVGDRDAAGQRDRGASVESAQDEERPQRDDEARQVRLDDGDAVEKADRNSEQQHDDDRRPDVPIGARRDDSEQEPGAADHDARREIELPTDHQQRHRHRDDPDVRRRVEPRAPDREVGCPADLACRDREQHEHGHRADSGSGVRTLQKALEEPDANDALVPSGYRGDVSHQARSSGSRVVVGFNQISPRHPSAVAGWRLQPPPRCAAATGCPSWRALPPWRRSPC